MDRLLARSEHHPSNFRFLLGAALALTACFLFSAHAQTSPPESATAEDVRQLRALIGELQARDARLEAEVEELKAELHPQTTNTVTGSRVEPTTVRELSSTDPPQAASHEQLTASPITPADRGVLDFLKGNTVNFAFDGYYAYNFNHPYGRVNYLRAYDVSSNAFSLNQASVIFEHAPDVASGHRFGARLDLQFGQATETLQGNPANEPRPKVYRNIFQAYGTYVVPVGRGLTVDFGKWGSALGIESNYTKDQINYSRALWFDFLPFYHMGLRANFPITNKLAVNYWVVNGTQQTEPTNAFKHQLFGLVLTPHKSVSWTINYYLGQDHPDVRSVSNSGPVPVQPGLSFVPIRPAPDGLLHIFDSYVSWQASPKLTLAGEGDYVIERLWRHTAAGQSSAPSVTAGGVVYARYQFTPHVALGGRAEYMSDRDGLFSGASQALKETTLTFDYKLAEGFLMRYEWRRDFSNQPYFQTDTFEGRSQHQTTATVGLLWWFGRKQGTW